MKPRSSLHRLSSFLRVGLLVALASVSARADLAFDFESGSEGWTVSGDLEDFHYTSGGLATLGEPLHYAEFGNPDGYIGHDESVSGANVYFIGPESLRGDIRAYAGGTLNYSLRINTLEASLTADFRPGVDVVIISPLATVFLPFKITAVNNPINPVYAVTGEVTAAGWRDYSFSLGADEGWQFMVNGTDVFAPATEEQMRAVLGNVAVFAILGEYIDGGEYGNLDTVRLSVAAVPEPASFALVGGLGVLVFAAGRRKRRTRVRSDAC